MSKYIVCMIIDDLSQKIYQYYIVGKKNLETLKKFNMTRDPGNCGCYGCIYCALGGFDMKYHSHKKIKNESELAIAKYVCHDQFYELEEFLNPDENYWSVPYKSAEASSR